MYSAWENNNPITQWILRNVTLVFVVRVEYKLFIAVLFSSVSTEKKVALPNQYSTNYYEKNSHLPLESNWKLSFSYFAFLGRGPDLTGASSASSSASWFAIWSNSCGR